MTSEARAIPLEKTRTESIVRFDVHQRIQHILLALSFVDLVLTGLPLKFANASISQWWVAIWGGIEATRLAHRVGAWVIVMVSVYHIAYLVYNVFGLHRPFPVRMIPSLKDAKDFVHDLAYSFGLRSNRPMYDRYDWRQKFDYWAIFWGMPVMAGSGFVLMFPVFFTKFLPGWIVPGALVAHSDEAMLALTWIFVVHIFFSHFAPGSFPANTSIFTGRVSKEKYRKEHPIEYARIMETASGPVAKSDVVIRRAEAEGTRE
jgi:formate dehydrogenase subunit gamma